MRSFTTFIKGHKFSEETLQKMSNSKKGIVPKNMKIIGWNKGKTFSEEHKRKMSESQKGISRPYAKLKKGLKMSDDSKMKMSISAKGKRLTEDTKKKIAVAVKKRMSSVEVRLGLSEKLKGERNHNWKGGITSENHKIRESIEYRLWREAVFARDNFTCQECRVRGCKLEAHHIKHFAFFPELRMAIDNGFTLCKGCHKNKHKKHE